MFLHGLLANMQETAFGTASFLQGMAPVRFSLPGGFLVVMARARPLTDEEWAAFDYTAFVVRETYCIPAENKRSSFGVFAGDIVAVDYG